jgi:hypothetical protein
LEITRPVSGVARFQIIQPAGQEVVVDGGIDGRWRFVVGQIVRKGRRNRNITETPMYAEATPFGGVASAYIAPSALHLLGSRAVLRGERNPQYLAQTLGQIR